MKIPEKSLGRWAQDIIDQCMVSQKQRCNDGALFKEYYFNGSGSGKMATYNKCGSHIDRMASTLFSPNDVHFQLTFETPDKRYLSMGKTSGRYLSYEFHRNDVDLAVGSAVEWALVKNSTFIKTVWGHEGFQSSVVQPEVMGVFREDICGLERQEAFNHQIFLTPGQFANLVNGHPEEGELNAQVQMMQSSKTEDALDADYFHQVIIGGINPVQTTSGNSPQYGMSQVFGGPLATLAPEVKSNLIILNELWVRDDERDDWTTIQMVSPDIVIEGKLRRRNICGVEGETPFEQICPNHIEGYFWGRSELAPLRPIQDQINRRMGEIDRISRLRAKPPRMISGTSGITDQIKQSMNSPGGYFVESNPSVKQESLAPEMPPELPQQVATLIEYFDDVGGFPAVTQGQGEQGIRSGVHAETLMKSASTRMRDRAMLVERQCGNVGDFCLKLLQHKIAKSFKTKDGEEFLLSQLPDDVKVEVDSHSSSPAFSTETTQQALTLLKVGAIDPIEFIQLTHPAMEDILLDKAEERQKAAQEEKEDITKEAKKDPKLFEKLISSMFSGKKR